MVRSVRQRGRSVSRVPSEPHSRTGWWRPLNALASMADHPVAPELRAEMCATPPDPSGPRRPSTGQGPVARRSASCQNSTDARWSPSYAASRARAAMRASARCWPTRSAMRPTNPARCARKIRSGSARLTETRYELRKSLTDLTGTRLHRSLSAGGSRGRHASFPRRCRAPGSLPSLPLSDKERPLSQPVTVGGDSSPGCVFEECPHRSRAHPPKSPPRSPSRPARLGGTGALRA